MRGWLVVMRGAAILLAAELRRPCNGCRPGGTRMRIAGGWRITEAEPWDCDALNLVAPAFIEFTEDGSSGSFGFVAVQGEMDCREVERDGRPGVEFSWEGNDECDPASGRGWAGLGGRLAVRTHLLPPWRRLRLHGGPRNPDSPASWTKGGVPGARSSAQAAPGAALASRPDPPSFGRPASNGASPLMRFADRDFADGMPCPGDRHAAHLPVRG